MSDEWESWKQGGDTSYGAQRLDLQIGSVFLSTIAEGHRHFDVLHPNGAVLLGCQIGYHFETHEGSYGYTFSEVSPVAVTPEGWTIVVERGMKLRRTAGSPEREAAALNAKKKAKLRSRKAELRAELAKVEADLDD